MYQPAPLPDSRLYTLDEIVQHFHRELTVISNTFALVEQGRFIPESTAEPKKKATRMLVYADGTNWNPGSGAGYYFWSGAAWVPLHT